MNIYSALQAKRFSARALLVSGGWQRARGLWTQNSAQTYNHTRGGRKRKHEHTHTSESWGVIASDVLCVRKMLEGFRS